MKIVLILLISGLSCLAQQALNSDLLNFNGIVEGAVMGDDGTPVDGGLVNLTLLPPYPDATNIQTEWIATSDGIGTFRFEGLRSGTYTLCVDAASGAWLDPCEWGLSPTTFSLSVAEPAAKPVLTLKKGAIINVRVNDPNQFLAQNAGKQSGANLLIGVPNDAHAFHVAPVTSQDSGGRYQQVVVPFDSSASLTVFSGFFKLADSNGAALPAAVFTIPISVAAGQQLPLITMAVTGEIQQ